MKVVVTGASGFIGKRLVEAIRLDAKLEVTAFTSRPVSENCIVYRSVLDFGLSPSALVSIEEADVLIHAGAFIPKCVSHANQFEGSSNNIAFTERLLALPWKKLKKIIFLSTVDVYARSGAVISETTPTAPVSLYGLSKVYCERMVELYVAERNIASQVLRIGHVYGPGEEKYDKVIPVAIRNIVAGKDLELWGRGDELRSFIYIDDVVTAILNAVRLQQQPGVINVVGAGSISVRKLLEKLIDIGGGGSRLEQLEFAGAANDLVFDNGMLRRYLLPNETDFTSGLLSEFRHVEELFANVEC